MTPGTLAKNKTKNWRKKILTYLPLFFVGFCPVTRALETYIPGPTVFALNTIVDREQPTQSATPVTTVDNCTLV